MPSANTLVRWMNENAFASIVQARPCPTFGRPVHRRGSPHRLRPGTSPHALRIPPRDGHPALRSAKLALRPASRYSRFRIWLPSSGRQRDFNPPEQCAAQRTLCPLLTSAPQSGSSQHSQSPKRSLGRAVINQVDANVSRGRCPRRSRNAHAWNVRLRGRGHRVSRNQRASQTIICVH